MIFRAKHNFVTKSVIAAAINIFESSKSNMLSKILTSIGHRVSLVRSPLFNSLGRYIRQFGTSIAQIQVSGLIIHVNSYYDKKKERYVVVITYLLNTEETSVEVPSSFDLSRKDFSDSQVMQKGATYERFYLESHMVDEFKKLKKLPVEADFSIKIGKYGSNTQILVNSFSLKSQAKK